MGLWFFIYDIWVIFKYQWCLILRIPISKVNFKLCYYYCSYSIVTFFTGPISESCWAHSVVSVLCLCPFQGSYNTTNIILVLLKSWEVETARMSLKGSWTLTSFWEFVVVALYDMVALSWQSIFQVYFIIFIWNCGKIPTT